MSRPARAATEASRMAFAVEVSDGLNSNTHRKPKVFRKSHASSDSSEDHHRQQPLVFEGALHDDCDWSNRDHIQRVVRHVYRKVQTSRTKRKGERLKRALLESRDAVLERAREVKRQAALQSEQNHDELLFRDTPKAKADRKSGQSTVAAKMYSRLPSNSCPQPVDMAELLACIPCYSEQSSWTQWSARNKSFPLNHSLSHSDGGVDKEPAPKAPSSGRQRASRSKDVFNKKDSIQFKVRQRNRRDYMEAHSPVLHLEGSHNPRPFSSATIFLKTHYSTEDMQNLTYVPYFGDDDKEDVVSELFDTKDREKMMEFGSEHQERETNDFVDDVLRRFMSRYRDGILTAEKARAAASLVEVTASTFSENQCQETTDAKISSSSQHNKHSLLKQVHETLATTMNLRVERIVERHKLCFAEEESVALPSSDLILSDGVTGTSVVSNNQCSDPGGSAPASSTFTEPMILAVGRKKNNDEEVGHTFSVVKNSSTTIALSYEDVMDSYRNLFCRRCFTYDCNIHGNLPKPNLDLQGELAMQKELDGDWNDLDPFPERSTSSLHDISIRPGDAAALKSSVLLSSILPSPENMCPIINANASLYDETEGENKLSPLQQSLCERAFFVYKGDIEKLASAMCAKPDAIKSYVVERNFESKAPVHVTADPSHELRRKKKRNADSSNELKRKKKKNADTTSMKNYNVAWLKRVQHAEIHPLFIPCDHSEPCSDQTCSCVKNAFFCTKHCVWGSKSRNFFRGCACKGGQCRTKTCACFAAKRECDPDLCLTCGACTDSPNLPAIHQRCLNDNLGMRRHCHLLLAESSVENAGWGIYTKHALKKGDFVHEYVGEVISQEEAERRGRTYDKVNRSYLFNLSSDYVVDASRKGNKTKFANHSSKPNCYTRMVSVNGDIRIGIFAKEDIEPQSEIFFDYRYDVGMDNDLIVKPGKTVDWMKNPKMANQISKKYA